MNSESRSCQNCKQSFVIVPEDFDFYERIKVPPPTFCPECRRQRRFMFRNERTFYKRPCDLCKNEVIALYPAVAPFPVYCVPCWYSDGWDAQEWGAEYDPQEPFLNQFRELFKQVPRPALIASNNVNSPYVNFAEGNKNSYLVNCSGNCENSAYCDRSFRCKESFDSFGLVDSEFCYQCNQCSKCFRTALASNCENVLDSICVTNCRNSSCCLGCVNIRNQSYRYLNQPVAKEEYNRKVQQLGSYTELLKLQQAIRELSLKLPHRFAYIVLSTNSDGDELVETKNCHNSFFVRNGENLRYAYFCSNIKDGQDFNFADNSELIYESSNIEKNYNELFSLTCWFSNNISYCDLCLSSSNLLGCVGLRNKQYCILNKTYSKEQYESLRRSIIQDMSVRPYVDAQGQIYSCGEFFPSELSPFAYNETIAQDHFPLSKAQAIGKGYKWKEPEQRKYAITMPATALPDHIREVKDSIAENIIGCFHEGTCSEQCTTAFRITPQELQFYRQMNLPLPRLCPNCRYYERLANRNPMRLWQRKCQCGGKIAEGGEYLNVADHFHGKDSCPSEFRTTFAPDRPEIVYCEQCYQQEVA